MIAAILENPAAAVYYPCRFSVRNDGVFNVRVIIRCSSKEEKYKQQCQE